MTPCLRRSIWWSVVLLFVAAGISEAGQRPAGDEIVGQTTNPSR
jgi:hypothetical protein